MYTFTRISELGNSIFDLWQPTGPWPIPRSFLPVKLQESSAICYTKPRCRKCPEAVYIWEVRITSQVSSYSVTESASWAPKSEAMLTSASFVSSFFLQLGNPIITASSLFTAHTSRMGTSYRLLKSNLPSLDLDLLCAHEFPKGTKRQWKSLHHPSTL